ncbi:MAG: Asp-tRNA(Asn)/Glu-tRNA(Gln) amidotransferase subunit GatA [Acidobacteriota bacterium]
MADLFELSVHELHDAIERREASVRDVVSAFAERASRLERSLHAWNLLYDGPALRQAERLDEEIAAGREVGPLTGIHVAIKDNMCVAGMLTNAGSRILSRYVAPYDATAVARLKAAGAIVLGKTNLDEFAMGSSTENSAFGPTRNPWDLSRAPGGSSGGSAAAVAARAVPLALGSDTGGSIRQPAAFCGVVGVKPTYGRVSRYGLIAFASSLDQIGPFAGCVRDAAVCLAAISGVDPRDATSVDAAVPDYAGLLDVVPEPRGARIGVTEGWFGPGMDPALGAVLSGVLKRLEGAGALLRAVDLPHAEHAIPVYYVLATAEASSNLARFDGVRYGYRHEPSTELGSLYARSRSDGFGGEVKRRIILGTYALSAGYYDAFYAKAQRVRTLISRDFSRAFESVDLIVAPCTPTPPFALGEKTGDPLAMYLSDVYTTPASLAGLPAASVPAGTVGEPPLPVGLQVIGPPLAESRVLQAARWIEDLVGRAPCAPCM